MSREFLFLVLFPQIPTSLILATVFFGYVGLLMATLLLTAYPLNEIRKRQRTISHSHKMTPEQALELYTKVVKK